jgi:hypothetical protein
VRPSNWAANLAEPSSFQGPGQRAGRNAAIATRGYSVLSARSKTVECAQVASTVLEQARGESEPATDQPVR